MAKIDDAAKVRRLRAESIKKFRAENNPEFCGGCNRPKTEVVLSAVKHFGERFCVSCTEEMRRGEVPYGRR